MSKDIWHTTKERPMLHTDIILCGDGWSMPMDIIPETVDNICWENVEKWCYVDELIKENDRTRKALDFTRKGFDAAREAALLFCKRTDIAMCALAKISKQHPGTCNKEWYVAVARDALEQITALEQKDK